MAETNLFNKLDPREKTAKMNEKQTKLDAMGVKGWAGPANIAATKPTDEAFVNGSVTVATKAGLTLVAPTAPTQPTTSAAAPADEAEVVEETAPKAE